MYTKSILGSIFLVVFLPLTGCESLAIKVARVAYPEAAELHQAAEADLARRKTMEKSECAKDDSRAEEILGKKRCGPTRGE